MRIFNFTFVVLLSLMLFGCYSSDDEVFGRSVNLSISDAITFDNQGNYSVGDTLFFELRFSRYLKEEGYTSLLDIFETSKSETFSYSFGISKFSSFSESFETVNIAPGLILGSRPDDAVNNGNFYGSTNFVAALNAEQTEYASTVGVVLVEEGRYNLDLDFIKLRSGYDYDKISVSIDHSMTIENKLVTEFSVGEN